MRYISLLFFIFLTACAATQETDIAAEPRLSESQTRLLKVIHAEHRTAEFAERDYYRHPYETLRFFEVEPDMAVGEIWPSKGWYAEILAPYLKGTGTYYAIGFSENAQRTPEWRKTMQAELNTKFAENPEVYGEAIITGMSIPEETEIAPAGSLDRVLTFRNVHNWMKGGYAEGVFAAMYTALKPGGILGVVEHRAKPGTSLEQMIVSGYVTEEQVVQYAMEAGFVLLERSEINSNYKDTADHPKGVWTLPPTLRLGEQDRKKYLAIGESDRMTLKFLKPLL